MLNLLHEVCKLCTIKIQNDFEFMFFLKTSLHALALGKGIPGHEVDELFGKIFEENRPRGWHFNICERVK